MEHTGISSLAYIFWGTQSLKINLCSKNNKYNKISKNIRNLNYNVSKNIKIKCNNKKINMKIKHKV